MHIPLYEQKFIYYYYIIMVKTLSIFTGKEVQNANVYDEMLKFTMKPYLL